MSDRCQADFYAWIGFVDMFVEVGFDDAVVVDAEPLA